MWPSAKITTVTGVGIRKALDVRGRRMLGTSMRVELGHHSYQ